MIYAQVTVLLAGPDLMFETNNYASGLQDYQSNHCTGGSYIDCPVAIHLVSAVFHSPGVIFLKQIKPA